MRRIRSITDVRPGEEEMELIDNYVNSMEKRSKKRMEEQALEEYIVSNLPNLK